MRVLGAPPRTTINLHHKIIDHKAERVEYLVKEVVRTSSQPHIKSAWPSSDPDSNSGLQLLSEFEGYHTAKLPSNIQ